MYHMLHCINWQPGKVLYYPLHSHGHKNVCIFIIECEIIHRFCWKPRCSASYTQKGQAYFLCTPFCALPCQKWHAQTVGSPACPQFTYCRCCKQRRQYYRFTASIIYNCFDKECPTQVYTRQCRLALWVVRVWLCVIRVQGDSATRNERERIHVFVLFPYTALKHLEVRSSNVTVKAPLPIISFGIVA